MSTTRLDPSGMSRVIGGKRYSVNSATLLADDDWDGNTKSGRNTFLYRTRGGAFFVAYMTRWQGERDHIEAMERSEAMDLYEQLPMHYVTYEEAFDAIVEEASAGRPAIYNNQPLKQTAVWLTEKQAAWLKSQPGGMSEAIRKLIEQAMV